MREPCYEEGRIGKIVLLVIVCSALDYFNDFTFNFIDDSVIFINTATPIARKVVFEWFWFAKSLVTSSFNILYNGICFFQKLFVVLKLEIISPSFIVPNFFHITPR